MDRPLLSPNRADLGLAALMEQTVRSMYDKRGPHEIHPGQWSALRFLSRAGEEARTVNGLATFLGVTPAPASRAAAALVKRGFVTQEPNPNDRRSHTLSLTEDGRAALAQDPIARLANAVGELDGDVRRAVTRALTQIHHSLTGGV
ncbi:MAG: MarR family transcriptional regulator [Alphaproteobacteria bacterium]